jgi:hypothetical protein
MLMHTCCCISFIVMSSFDPKLKMIQNHLKMNLEKLYWKKKSKFFSLPLPSSLSACWPSFSPVGPLASLPLFSSWAGPTELATVAAPSFLSTAHTLGPLVGAVAHLPRRARSRQNRRCSRHSSRRGSVPVPQPL